MARQAFDLLNQRLTTSEPMHSIEVGAMETAEVFRNIHSMLTHTANISRLLWPGNKQKSARKQRAEALRLLLDLPADDHLLSDRTLRDDLEHFDERLDRWTTSSDAAPDYWQDCIGSWDVPHQQYGVKERNVMRHFDPSTQIFRFQGRPWNIPEMIDAVQALQHCVDAKVVQLISILYPQPDISPSPVIPE
ncbi:hypothetical protein [Parapusillimonas granuli]|uniref:Uncharacterized protein n=1 Tax=Parapusillimonas granuli TaxID=380911 RepID=A0A853FYA1_9BURK|nr:hypothetical protein [Parapusillimonas granuli]MBB5217181.1 hypothetical protein [Parapusillimonas granuli]NYT51025.1 hypothetical protein [Parapusillimonas granuli]